MTKSNNEFVPELGEWCEGTTESGTFFKCRIVGVFQGPYPEAKCIVFQYEDGGIGAATEGNSYTFRPIKTEAERRRDLAVAEMKADYRDTQIVKTAFDDAFCEKLIDAGWCKPKPLTDEALKELMGPSFKSHGIEFDRNVVNHINAYICGELDL